MTELEWKIKECIEAMAAAPSDHVELAVDMVAQMLATDDADDTIERLASGMKFAKRAGMRQARWGDILFHRRKGGSHP